MMKGVPAAKRRLMEKANLRRYGDVLSRASDHGKKYMEQLFRSPKSGRVYTWISSRQSGLPPEMYIALPGRKPFPAAERGSPHQASAPGEPPAVDTGRLLRSLHSRITVSASNRLRITWTSDDADMILLMKYLENGTQYMRKRPFIDRVKKEMRSFILQEMRKKVGK